MLACLLAAAAASSGPSRIGRARGERLKAALPVGACAVRVRRALFVHEIVAQSLIVSLFGALRVILSVAIERRKYQSVLKWNVKIVD